MTVATQRKYKVMMILDTRGREESVEDLIEELRKEITGLGEEVLDVEHLGRRDFARVTDARLTAGNYIELTVAGAPGLASRLREHFRLNPVVYRIFTQRMRA